VNTYKIFIDTEFNQEVDPVELISIGLVTSTGRQFYATMSDFDRAKCDSWLQKNVLSIYEDRDAFGLKDGQSDPVYFQGIGKEQLKKELLYFIGQDKFDAWGYYADYDWYLFTRLWGFRNMPGNFPMLCFDVKQFAHHKKIRSITEHVPEFKPEHHALVDARWTKKAYEFVNDYQGAPLQ
jgi:hypothetical protein